MRGKSTGHDDAESVGRGQACIPTSAKVQSDETRRAACRARAERAIASKTNDLGSSRATRQSWIGRRAVSAEQLRKASERVEHFVAPAQLLHALSALLCGVSLRSLAMSVLSPRIGATLPRLVHGPVRDIVTSALRLGPLPAHIALVMDGNRRLARREGIQTLRGHELGFEALKGVR